MKHRYFLAAVCGPVALMAVPALAQDFFGHIISGATGNDPIGTALRDSNSVPDVVLNETPGPAASGAPSLDYRRDKRRTRQNLAEFVERTAATDKAAARELEKLFAFQPNIMDEIGGVMQSYGLDPANVADAYALWWMSAWLVANQRQDTPTKSTFAAVRDQARNAFAATPGFAEVDDAGKQKYAEALMLQAALLNTALEQSANQPEMLAQLAQAAKQGALASGLDLNTMVLTENGFVPREGADASDERNVSLATEQTDGAATYLGLAVVAGAGIAVAFFVGRSFGKTG
ncbi:DUF6683 family protein [Altererythrobacter sp. CAU 1778]